MKPYLKEQGTGPERDFGFFKFKCNLPASHGPETKPVLGIEMSINDAGASS